MTTPATVPAASDNSQPIDLAKGGVTVLADTLDAIVKGQEKQAERMNALEKSMAEASKTQYPYGIPGSGPAIRKGEDPLTSRPYSLMAVARALTKKANNDNDWASHAKVEFELSNELSKAYYQSMNFMTGNLLVPLGSELMPTTETELADGSKLGGIDAALVRKCRDLMAPSLSGFDFDEFAHIAKQHGSYSLRKDLSVNTATAGGTLIGLASQGELIEQLKAMEFFSQAGAQQITLPPQGSIRFPRQTSSLTIYATSEATTVTESTPGTSELLLAAKAYSGLVDIPEELLKFATSVSVEAWLRQEFLTELRLKTDRDMISGAGGTSIQGLINYSGVRLVTASTTGAQGDTLDPEDPIRLYADIADQNAPVDRGWFYGMTNSLWAGLTTRKASTSGEFMFNVATHMLGNGKITKSLGGERVITSTQVPTDRAKGAATNLTMLLGGVPSELVIARAGVVEIDMTNSDGSKFGQRLRTMRGTSYIDAGPRHENSFGYIDDLLNS